MRLAGQVMRRERRGGEGSLTMLFEGFSLVSEEVMVVMLVWNSERGYILR